MKAVTEFVVSVMRTEGPVGNGGVEYLRIRSHSCRDFFFLLLLLRQELTEVHCSYVAHRTMQIV